MPDADTNTSPATLPNGGESAPSSVADRNFLSLVRLATDQRRDHEPLPVSPAEVKRFVNDLILPVQEWFRAHADKVSRCYLATHERMLAVYVIIAQGEYDYSLSRPLSDLEMGLGRKGWSCVVLQLAPGGPSRWQAFFDESKAIEVPLHPGGPITHAHSGPTSADS
jgi:hypothetical protein